MATAVITTTVHQNFGLNFPITKTAVVANSTCHISTSYAVRESTCPRTRDRLTMAQQ